MNEEIEQLSISVWSHLFNAIDNPDHPYWLLNLATVTANASPENRIVVLREVDTKNFTLCHDHICRTADVTTQILFPPAGGCAIFNFL